MKSPRTLLVCVLLGLLVIVAAGLQGTARFTGLRWVPDWNPIRSTVPPISNPSLARPTQLPEAAPGAGTHADLSKILMWAAIGIALVIAAFLLWRWLSGRPPRSAFGLRDVGALTAMPPDVVPEPVPEPEPEAPALQRGVHQALQALNVEREPGDAVMRAWLGLQQTAEDSGILHRAAETPTEFTSRIMSHVSADDSAIRALLTLYLRTRFGDHPVTATDVARAREALAGLVRSWDDGRAAGAAGAVPSGSSRPPTGQPAPGQSKWPSP